MLRKSSECEVCETPKLVNDLTQTLSNDIPGAKPNKSTPCLLTRRTQPPPLWKEKEIKPSIACFDVSWRFATTGPDVPWASGPRAPNPLSRIFLVDVT